MMCTVVGNKYCLGQRWDLNLGLKYLYYVFGLPAYCNPYSLLLGQPHIASICIGVIWASQSSLLQGGGQILNF